MNANASPLRTKDAEQVTPGPGMILLADRLDEGFHVLVAQHATHKILDAGVACGIRADLAQLMIYPEVTFAACLPDGTMVVCCPNGLPQELTGIAVNMVGERGLALPPQQGHRRSGLGSKLERLDKKLDEVLAVRLDHERLSDRVEAVEFSLVDELDRNGGPDVVAALAAVSNQLNAITTRTDFAPVLHGLEKATERILADLDQRPDHVALLERLEVRLDDLANRPAPQPDMTLQRLGFANFLTAMSSVIKRMEGAVDRVAPSGLTPEQDSRLRLLEQHVLALPSPPDIAPMAAQLTRLQRDIAQTYGTPATLTQLSERIDSMARRPDPVLDLTQQRQSFASFAVAMGSAVKRLEATAQVFERQPDLASVRSELDSLKAVVSRPAQSASTPHGPALDLTDLRQSLASFSSALDDVVTRLATREDQTPAKVAAETADNPEAAFATATTLPERPDQHPATVAAQQGFDQHLRYAMAESLAVQIKTLAGKK